MCSSTNWSLNSRNIIADVRNSQPAGRRRVHGVARWARDLTLSSRAHLLVEVELSRSSNPDIYRDVQYSIVLNVAVAVQGAVLHGATRLHAAAPFHAASLVVSDTEVHVVAIDVTAWVLEEGFL